MKDKDYVEMLFRAVKMGSIDAEFAVTKIINLLGSSKRFNWHSFKLGAIFVFALELLRYLYQSHISHM